MEKRIYPGLRVQTIAGEQDTGHKGTERDTPPGTWGHIAAHNHADHWDLVFPNGGWVVVTEAELSDSTQYMLGEPQTLEQCALALQYGQKQMELTILDDWMMPFTERIAGNPHQILDLIKELNAIKEQAEA